MTVALKSYKVKLASYLTKSYIPIGKTCLRKLQQADEANTAQSKLMHTDSKTN